MKNYLLIFLFLTGMFSISFGQKYIDPLTPIIKKSDDAIHIQCFNFEVTPNDTPRLSLYNQTDSLVLEPVQIYGKNIAFDIETDSLYYGYYSMIYSDKHNGSASFLNALFYTNSEYSIPQNHKKLFPDSNQWVEIQFYNSINSLGVDSVFLINQSHKIQSDSIVILGNDYFKFRTPIGSNAVGMYHLEIYRSDGVLRYYPDYFYIQNPTQTYIYPLADSTGSMNNATTLNIYGNNTYFASNKTGVAFYYDYMQAQLYTHIYDTTIINDTTVQIRIVVQLPIKSILFLPTIIKVYNDVDGLLKCPVVVGFSVSYANIQERKNGFNNLNVFPNPASDFLVLESPDFKLGEKYTVEIYSTDGKRISKQEISGSNILRINILNLASGSYFLRVSSENRTQAKPFIVE